MIRNLKVLGIVLVALCVMSVMAVSGASAEFTTTKGATVFGSGSIKITVTGQEISCNENNFSGVAPASSFEAVETSPTFNECTGAGFSTKVTGFGQYGESNTCWFIFWTDGTVDLHCDPVAQVTFDMATCVVHIHEQTNIGTVTYTTGVAEGKHDLLLHVNLSNISATHTDGFLCPFGSSGMGVASIHGTLTVHAEAPIGTRVDITHDLWS